MSDYFDRVEQELREAVRRRAHAPWYARLRLGRSRPLVVLVACLIAAGSALAASGVFQTGSPVEPVSPFVPDAGRGVAIAGSVRLLALRVSDPDGGPPWGLRVLKTTRGLMCVQLGRVADGRIGVLGRDGAFANDGRFHPLGADFLGGGASNCGTEDRNGQAFINEADYGIPASGLLGYEAQVRRGCYMPHPSSRACPPGDLRDVFLGLLGPDAESITYVGASGAMTTVPTVGREGAYLIVLPHSGKACLPEDVVCTRNLRGETGGPELAQEESGGVIRAVNYRGAASCHLSGPREQEQERSAQEASVARALRARYPAIYRLAYHGGRVIRASIERLTPRQLAEYEAVRAPRELARRPRCPEVGYVAPRTRRVRSAEVASPLEVRLEPSRHYCERGELTVPCGANVPRGYRRIDLAGGPPELLLEVSFVSRVAITSANSHYEVNTSNPDDPANPKCPGPGGGSFGPTESDLRAGQRVRYTEFVNAECRGRSHITVGLVRVDGPSEGTPVPGLPGQSAEIPVGQASVMVP